jgi:hypothetical protein
LSGHDPSVAVASNLGGTRAASQWYPVDSFSQMS